MATPLVFSIPHVGKLIALPQVQAQWMTLELAIEGLQATWEQVCDAYGLEMDTVVGGDVISHIYAFALGHSDDAGMFRAMAFGHLATACQKAMTLSEERNGFQQTQHHMFQAVAWAAIGMLRG